MQQYILLLHEKPSGFAHVSPAEMAEVVQQYKAWAGQLAQQGLLAGGEKLSDDGGRHLSSKDGRPLAVDGPYAEAHDVIGGYFVVKAADAAAAEALASTCPHLAHGGWIEIRRIDLVGS